MNKQISNRIDKIAAAQTEASSDIDIATILLDRRKIRDKKPQHTLRELHAIAKINGMDGRIAQAMIRVRKYKPDADSLN